jgi:hypothetical protein
MGFSSTNDSDVVRRVVLTLLVTAVGLAAVFVVFASLFNWLTAIIAIGIIIIILVIASASPYPFLNVFVPLVTVTLVVGFFVLEDRFGWERALIAIGVTILILLIAGWVVFRIWRSLSDSPGS